MKLTMNEVAVICMRFGLHGSEELSLSKISNKMKCSRQNIYNIEKRALAKLKNHPKIKDLKSNMIFPESEQRTPISRKISGSPFLNQY